MGGGVCCLGGRHVLFVAVWAGAWFGRVAYFIVCCPFGWGGRVCVCVCVCFFFFFAVWAGTGVHSLTDLPGRAFRGLTTKKTKQQQNNIGSRLSGGTTCHEDVGL